MTAMTSAQILCVDDDPRLLDLLSRTLRQRFEVVTALGGEAGLGQIKANPQLAVVMSDLRMPRVNGVAVLNAARQFAPDATRVLLTGQADLNAAIAAVNEGQIYRFLTKPCQSEVLVRALTQAVDQHRLVTAERDLLERTLHGSVQALVEVLALADPAAFGVATRARRLMGELAELIGFRDRWQMEMAAMLSQIGAVTLPADTAQRYAAGATLTSDEEALVARLPDAALRLLGEIPRLEEIRAILGHVGARFAGGARNQVLQGEAIPLGARMLRVVLDFDTLRSRGYAASDSIQRLRAHEGWYDPDVLSDLATVIGAESGEEICELRFQDVKLGMIFVDDVRRSDGTLLVARGQEVTPSLLDRIANYWADLDLPGPVRVHRARKTG